MLPYNKKKESYQTRVQNQQQIPGSHRKRKRFRHMDHGHVTLVLPSHDRCTEANKVLGSLRRAAMEITDVKIRIVRSTLGYATQVWSPQSIDLITRTERIQRRATVHFEVTVRVRRKVQRQIDHLQVTPNHLLARISWYYVFKAISKYVTI